MQSSGPSMPHSLPMHMQPGGSSMSRPMPFEDDTNAPSDTSAPGDTNALGDTSSPGDNSAPGDTSSQGDISAPEEQTRRDHILRRNVPQKIKYHHGRLIIWPDSGFGGFGGTSGYGGVIEEEEQEEQDE
ncbi:hypothetical protein RYX36_007477 [Vicia faba]